MRFYSIGLVSAVVGLGVLAPATGEDKQAGRIKDGLDAFRAFLKKHYPNKKYKTGPTHLNSAVLRNAYPQQRFYYVYTAVPLGPGANLGKLQEAHRRLVEDIRKHYLSLTVRVDAQGRVAPLTKPADYNIGLRKIASPDDARTAAAAVLSLVSSRQNSPGVVEPREVTVIKLHKGWSCRISHRTDPRVMSRGDFWGTVTFDAAGQCTSVSKTYAGPYPR